MSGKKKVLFVIFALASGVVANFVYTSYQKQGVPSEFAGAIENNSVNTEFDAGNTNTQVVATPDTRTVTVAPVTPVKKAPIVVASQGVIVTPTPIPKAVADYFPESIKVIGGANNTTTLQETASLFGMKVDAAFRNNAMTEGSGTVRVKVFYDGNYKTELTRAGYGAYSAIFSYTPPIEGGAHTVRFVINEDRGIQETNYDNNTQSISYTIIPDTVPPNFTIDTDHGPFLINGQTCMRWINLSDNVFTYTDVWAKWKIDDGAWSNKTSENPYGCITAESGTTHTYYVHAEDLRGNVTEKSQQFTQF